MSKSNSWLPSRRRSDYYLSQALRSLVAEYSASWRRDSIDRLIDFGCGSMPYSDLLSPICNEYIGCDLMGSGARVEFESGAHVSVASNSADVVVSFQVLEHVEDIGWYLGEVKRMLRPSGLLLLSTHGTWPYHPHPHDYRRWTREGLELDLKSNGFEVEAIHALVGPGAWTLMFQFGSIALFLGKLGLVGRSAASGLNWFVSFLLPWADRATPSIVRDNNASVYVVLARPRNGEQQDHA